MRAELGGVVGVIRAVATGLLVAGAKSFTHMITFVERYGAVLDGLLREAGPPVSCPERVCRPRVCAVSRNALQMRTHCGEHIAPHCSWRPCRTPRATALVAFSSLQQRPSFWLVWF